MSRFFRVKRITALVLGIALSASLVACGNSNKAPNKNELTGKIVIDGSSTVYPITMAIAEEFRNEQPDVEVSVAMSGTGGGMKKFTIGEIDICNASRKIKPEEIKSAKEHGIEYIELEVAYDGISIVVNKNNTFIDSLTVEELNKIWKKDSTVNTWKDVNPAWPAEPLKLYAPGTDSGTFEYFTEAINKKAKESRTDFTPSEDDNVLVQGIAGDKNAMGYFGFAYYEENMDKLKIVKVDNGKGPVEPTFDTIKSKEYSPLSRPMYIYVSKTKMTQAQVSSFVNYYLDTVEDIAKEVGYIPLSSYDAQKAKLKQ